MFDGPSVMSRLCDMLLNAPYPFTFEGLYDETVIKQSVVEWDTERNVLCWTHFKSSLRADNSRLRALVFLADLTGAFWAPKLQIDVDGFGTYPIIVFKFGRDRIKNMAVKRMRRLSKNQITRASANTILDMLGIRSDKHG